MVEEVGEVGEVEVEGEVDDTLCVRKTGAGGMDDEGSSPSPFSFF